MFPIVFLFTLHRVAIHAVERAVDVRVSHFASEDGQNEIKKVVKRNVPIEVLFRDQLYSPYDTPLTFINSEPPELGDRVMNLVATGVPFGLKGTVITIHSGTGYVEVILVFLPCLMIARFYLTKNLQLVKVFKAIVPNFEALWCRGVLC